MKKTVREELMDQFGCAISAVLGDLEDEDYDEEKISRDDIMAIAKKVCFYLDK